MYDPDHGGPERAFDVVVSETLYGNLKVLQQFSTACKEFRILRYPGDLADQIDFCRDSGASVLVVDSAPMLNRPLDSPNELLHGGCSPRVVTRAESDEPELLRKLLLHGYRGFFTDDASVALLEKIFSAVGRGELWFPRNLLSQVMEALVFEQSGSGLSRREREILGLLGQQLSNKQIAERLFISQETLRWHLRNLYAKTRVQGRDKLIKYANELHGIATTPSLEEEKAASGQHPAKPLVLKSSAV